VVILGYKKCRKVSTTVPVIFPWCFRLCSRPFEQQRDLLRSHVAANSQNPDGRLNHLSSLVEGVIPLDLQTRTLGRLANATPRTLKYLDILLIDCGFSDRIQRNAYLSREVNREITVLEDLKQVEASRLIQELLERKESNTPARRDDRDEEEDE
jgi:hypothetical protein